MLQIVLVDWGWSGCGAAVRIASGSIAAIFLFYLAPRDPDCRARLEPLAGSSPRSATAVIAVLSGVFVAVPVIAFGAWWLGYLTLLARPSANGGGTALEWYPVGRLVLWGAVIGTLIVAAAVPHFGTDLASLQAALRKMYERILTEKSLIDLLVVAVPPAAAVFSTITNLVNLWLAGRIVKISGRLPRPWPDVATLPPAASACSRRHSQASSRLSVGVLSGAGSEPAHGLRNLGFAVLHAITRG
jgi:hypothetical protein